MKNSIFTFMTLISILLTACAAPVTALPATATESTESSPTATIAPTVTEVPPTATATALPTLEPTPLPTANFTPEEFADTWNRFDQGRGNLFLTFNIDGTYVGAHGTINDVVHTGHYTLEGRLFTWIAKDGWSGCTDLDATYMVRYTGGGKYMTLEPLDDDCLDRADALRGFRWERYILPTATPAP